MDTSVIDINLDSTCETYSKPHPSFENRTDYIQPKVDLLDLIKTPKHEQEIVDTPKKILPCNKILYKSDLESKLNMKFPNCYFYYNHGKFRCPIFKCHSMFSVMNNLKRHLSDKHNIFDHSFISFMIKVKNCFVAEEEERIVPKYFQKELFMHSTYIKKEEKDESDSETTIDESSVIFKVIKYVQYCFSECWRHILHWLSKDYYDAAHELIKFLNEYYSLFPQEEINNIEQINNEKLFELKEFFFISQTLFINRKRKDLIQKLKSNMNNFILLLETN